MNQYIATYLRLSQEDSNACESNSLTSQRQIIQNYIDSVQEFSEFPITEFSDDGYSGTNFERPGVKRLLESVRKGEIYCIIVKDLSRFGRQYLEVSKFIEQIFPCLGVRFIAVNDHYDSNSHKGRTADMDVPVRNMINAMYSRDISKKVKSAKRTQMQNGIFAGAFAPFGYRKDGTDKHRLLIDEPAAKIVRRIFALAAEKHSAFQIADRLNTDGVLTPAAYKKKNASKLAHNDTARTFWTNSIVSRILRDERYTGVFIGGKHETIQIGTWKKCQIPKEQWIRIPGAVPAIITPEQYHCLAAKHQKYAKKIKPNIDRILYNKVRCGYCGYGMRYVGNAAVPYYICNTARYTKQYGCICNKCHTPQVINVVKIAVRLQISVVLDMPKRYMTNKKTMGHHIGPTVQNTKKISSEVVKLQVLKRQRYERYKDGVIDKNTLICQGEIIQRNIKAKTMECNSLPSNQEQQYDTLNSFFNSRLEHLGEVQPNSGMVNELVEAVYIYNVNRIEIQFCFTDELEKTFKAVSTMKIY